MKLIAIDPGNIVSGYTIIDTEPKYAHLKFKVIEHGNIDNFKLMKKIEENKYHLDLGLIEMIQSYGKPVGASIFDTCRWIGKFELTLTKLEIKNSLIFRPTVVSHVLKSVPGNKKGDAAVCGRLKKDFPKESKGLTDHAWQALALGVMYMESSNII